MAKTLLQRFERIWRLLQLCAALCGANVTHDDFKMSAFTWGLIIAINVFFVITGYTTYKSYTVEGDWTIMVQNLCTLGSGLQGYCKLLNGIAKRKLFIFMFKELVDIYKEYEVKDSSYRLCLERSLNVITKMIKVIASVYIAVQVALSMCPVYFYLVHNKRLFVLQFLFPGIDPNTDFGYITLNIMHLMCLFFGTFGNFAGDTHFFTVISSVPMLKDLLICKFHDLNKVLMEEPINRDDTKEKVKDILRWHQRYIIIIATSKEAVYWVLLVQIFANSTSIALTLFCIMLGRWPGGQVYLLYLVVILYVYCGLGTLMEVANDDVVNSCYNEVMWYKLTVEEQKMLQVMIAMTQTTQSLTVGGFAPMTMNMGVQVTKAVYTWTMMLMNFLHPE